MTDRGVPPKLDGFTFLEQIGQGGFADVFLYEQAMPRRKVAVKVLLSSAVDGPSQEQFTAEANVMAQLSGHPSIVPIYQAGTSQDHRPYLVMEYCPPPSLAGKFRAQRFEVPEALETMIKIAAAVETAHRAGVLHRDIKPHNILTSSFGAPMLTDFGIAGTTGNDEAEVAGLSVPWSPPEAFADVAPVDPRSDVWSLAATLYSLLAGRSPFEVPGAANDNATLMSRIERQPLSRISRPDIPEALHAVLERGMSKDLVGRHPTAMAFARSLQDVQAQLNLGQTRIDVLDASPSLVQVQDAEHRTQVRPVQIIVPDAEPGTRLKPIVIPQVVDAPTTDVSDHTVVRSTVAASDPVPDTMAKAGPAIADRTDGSHFLQIPDAVAAAPSASKPKAKLPLAILAGFALVAIGILVVAFVLPGGEAPDDSKGQAVEPSIAPNLEDVIGTVVLPPVLSHKSGPEGVTFSWKLAEDAKAESFLVRSGTDLSALSAATETRDKSIVVKTHKGDIACIEVVSVLEGTRSQAVRGCEVNR